MRCCSVSKVKRYKPGVIVTGYDPTIKCWMDNACAGHVHMITSRATKGPFDIYHQSVECMVCFKRREKVLVRWLRQKATAEDIQRCMDLLKEQVLIANEMHDALGLHLRRMEV